MGQIRFVFLCLFIILVVLLSLSASQDGSMTIVRALSSKDPLTWSLFADLYTGILLMSVWMFAQEQSRIRGVLWFFFFVMFGNIAVVTYLLVRTADATEDQVSWLFLPSRGGAGQAPGTAECA